MGTNLEYEHFHDFKPKNRDGIGRLLAGGQLDVSNPTCRGLIRLKSSKTAGKQNS